MRKIVKFAVFVLIHFFDTCVMCFFRKCNPKHSEYEKSICFIKLDGIGDCIILLKSFGMIYEYYNRQGYRISLLCSSPCKELYTERWVFDAVYELKLKELYNYKYRYQVIKKLQKVSFDVLVNCAYSRTFSVDSLVSVIQAKIKIGNFGDFANTPKTIKKITDKYYHRLASPNNEDCEYLHNVKLFNWLGAEDKTNESIAGHDDNKGISDYFVVFPGAGRINRCWPIEKFMQAALSIAQKKGLYVIICGGEAEAEPAGQLVDFLKKNDIFTKNMIGSTTINKTAELVRQSKFVLSNDTSGIHLANLFDIPNICIAKGCDIGRFIEPKDKESNYLFGNHIAIYHKKSCTESYKANCVRHRHILPCIADIAVEEVVNAALSLEEKC